MSDKYDNINLYVMPSFLPSEEKKPIDKQEMTIARKLGAEWSPGRYGMSIGPSSSDEDAKKLIALFGGDDARDRVELALERYLPERFIVDRWMMAKAAWDEVERQNGSVKRREQGPEVAPEDRIYFWTNNDKSSDFSVKNLEEVAERNNIHLNIDFEPRSDYFGLRYTDKNQVLSDELLFFASDDAKNDSDLYKLRLQMSRQLLANVSSSVAGNEAAIIRPLTLPKENSDIESEKFIVDNFHNMSKERQNKVLDVTASSVDRNKDVSQADIGKIVGRLRRSTEIDHQNYDHPDYPESKMKNRSPKER